MRCNQCGNDMGMEHPVRWPEDYLELEAVFCEYELSRFHASSKAGEYFNRMDVMHKRDKFNELWNKTHKEQFALVNRGRKE